MPLEINFLILGCKRKKLKAQYILLPCEFHLSSESEVTENSSILRFLIICFPLVIGQTFRQATWQHVSHFLCPSNPSLLIHPKEIIEHERSINEQEYSLGGCL